MLKKKNLTKTVAVPRQIAGDNVSYSLVTNNFQTNNTVSHSFCLTNLLKCPAAATESELIQEIHFLGPILLQTGLAEPCFSVN